MSNNLDLDQLAAAQNQKEITINDANAQIDAALTDDVTISVTSTNAYTLSDTEFRRYQFLIIDEDGGDPATAAITVTAPAISRGSFVVFNITAYDVTVEISGQSKTAPVIPADGHALLLCDGNDVIQSIGGIYLTELVEDTSPQLGGDLDRNGFEIGAYTASRALETDGSGNIAPSTVTSTELSYVGGVTSSIQPQLAAKLENVIEDTSPQLGGDLDRNGFEIGAYTASRALETDGSGNIAPSTVTSTELSYVSGVTSPIQTQFGKDLGEYTVAGLPTASSYPNYWALATDASGGRTVVRSDGSNWKVIAVEGATVTT